MPVHPPSTVGIGLQNCIRAIFCLHRNTVFFMQARQGLDYKIASVQFCNRKFFRKKLAACFLPTNDAPSLARFYVAKAEVRKALCRQKRRKEKNQKETISSNTLIANWSVMPEMYSITHFSKLSSSFMLNTSWVWHLIISLRPLS